ncbi:anchored repeat-type ABC transporter ATP-binding subunit [Corynebacterium lipophiloflavum]|uniref:Anchored repeat-type ABC transporter, ATP-binding subunit n=1 Tax=Corynebacterium lipophiloflavum (strain ATCC 700352 / DSM 44291 / CCUG 37336 / JCM 10383 / DMMZ 1944) TaxID=525263 RepID=C0XUJ4_CORLD|nr:anchored repeat-type ABC transporter ATP-binding subunit [Corynebacterium lipophiloflavum]EEI16019.1 anchored repeat-type ABC transporter, ATP-binding subunit [Corynebacterium lipophiloflavum DSM 44291]
MSTPLLRVTDLSAAYYERPVFERVSLELSEGEFIGLIGPNGAGKTTLIRAILGLVAVRGGTVTVSGREGSAVRDMVGYVPQRHDVAWDFPVDVRSAVLNGTLGQRPWWRGPGAEHVAAVDEALAAVNLDDLALRPIGELSGGQRQRVLVARALVRRPRVLLLDEPFTGLDIPSTEQLLALFRDLVGQGISIVMSTHNIVEAVDSCDRLILFRGGIVADGTPAELGDADPWMATFGVGPQSPWLRSLRRHVSEAAHA